MMRILRQIRRPSAPQCRIAIEATLALGAAAFSIAVFPFRKIAPAAPCRAPDGGSGEAERARQVAQVRWAVTACARRVPWRAKCFEQGLAAQWMLSRRRIASTLHYGLAKAEGELIAHVWLRSGSLDVIGCESEGDFTEVARFPIQHRGPNV
jgi:hypothetical protein